MQTKSSTWGNYTPLTVLVCLFFSSIHLFCGINRIKIEPVYSENRLSQSAGSAILQDQRGFFWFGTQSGLNRYDGYSFKTYLHDVSDGSTISGNYINALCEDRDGMLWIGFRSAGLNRYDWRTENFTRFRHDSNRVDSISHDTVTAILEDNDGRLWIGTLDGLNILDKNTGHFTTCHTGERSGRMGHESILTLHMDKEGILWIGTNGGGLMRREPKTGVFNYYQHDSRNSASISDNSVYAIYRDEAGLLWVGTGNGLNRFNPVAQTFHRYYYDVNNENSLSHNTVSSITPDHKGRLWIGTGSSSLVGRGITILDPSTMTFSRYLHRGPEAHRINNSAILSIYKDRSGSIWIGSFGSGIFKYDPEKYKFPHFNHQPDIPNSLNRNEIWSLLEDKNGNVWIGTLDGGLNFLDIRTGRFRYYMHQTGNPDSLIDNSVRALAEDRWGNLWVGTQKGLDRLDPVTGQFTHFHHKQNQPLNHGMPDNPITVVTIDYQDNIWVGTWDGGICVRDHKNGSFIRGMDGSGDSTASLFTKEGKITIIYQDRSRAIWVGSISNGLKCLDPDSGQLVGWKEKGGNGNVPDLNYVMTIYEDETSNLWLGTWGSGLYKWERKSGKLTRYTTSHGLPSESIYGVLGDENGNLWVATNNGMSKFIPSREKFTNYTQADGLQDDEFNQGAFHKGRSGFLYFGGINGFNRFNPNNIILNTLKPPIVITDFKVFGKSVHPNSQGIFRYNAADDIEISLSYRENHFSFQFAALEYTDSPGNRYAYRMEGFDDKWIYCGSRRYVNYTNLDGGVYVLRIKGANSDEIWNNEGIAVRIVITPPFWKTGWFYLLLGVLLSASIFMVFFIRTKSLKEKIRSQLIVQSKLKHSARELQKAKDVIDFRHAEIMKLIAAITSILIAVDSENKIYQWNGPAEAFFDLSREECLGLSLEAVFKEYMDTIEWEHFNRAVLHPGAGVAVQELKFRFNGSQAVLQVTVNPIMDKNETPRGFLLLGEDITNRKAEEAEQNLVLKLKAVGEMVTGILHEINTPVQYISINTAIVSRSLTELDGLFKELAGCLDIIEPGSTNNCTEAIRKLLAEKKIESLFEKVFNAAGLINTGVDRVMSASKTMKAFFHPGQEEMEMYDINKLIQSTLMVSQYKLQKAAEIHTQLAPGQLLTYCYPAELNLAFLNLILNALDAVKTVGKRGKITVSSQLKEKMIHVYIKDTGAGIPLEIQDKVFTPFFTTKGIGKGTGQGLAIALRIIQQQHGGQLYFDSDGQNGTTFHIHLPVRRVLPTADHSLLTGEIMHN